MRIYVLRDEVCLVILVTIQYVRLYFVVDAKIKQVTRDVKERGRDIDGCIKQWIAYVKPNFERYVQPQRKNAGTAFLD